MKTTFTKESFFSVPKKDLFTFHERKDAFRLLTPEWYKIDVINTATTLKPSDELVRFNARFGPLKFPFAMKHTEYHPYDLFVDEQLKGLFSSWRHEHRCIEAGWDKDPASMLSDSIEYAHPLLFLFNPFVSQRLKKLFQYRHQITREEMMNLSAAQSEVKDARIIVTGATGLIGKRIVQILQEKGVRPIVFVRNPERAQKALGSDVTLAKWDFSKPGKGDWQEQLANADGVIHLAGTPLFKQRWTSAFKEEMEKSRTESTTQLVDVIQSAPKKPKAFVSASAVGIYGTDPSIEVDENSGYGDDLLSRICINWEAASKKLETEGVRVVSMRIGVVLSKEAGALRELLLPFYAGLGGTMGAPHHFMNWIHLEDIARMFVMAVFNEEMSGPYNGVAPNPVYNKDFGKTLARVLKRPAFMKYPVSLLKLMIGEAGEYASGGPRVSSNRIQQAGYRFFFENLEDALKNSLS